MEGRIPWPCGVFRRCFGTAGSRFSLVDGGLSCYDAAVLRPKVIVPLSMLFLLVLLALRRRRLPIGCPGEIPLSSDGPSTRTSRMDRQNDFPRPDSGHQARPACLSPWRWVAFSSLLLNCPWGAFPVRHRVDVPPVCTGNSLSPVRRNMTGATIPVVRQKIGNQFWEARRR